MRRTRTPLELDLDAIRRSLLKVWSGPHGGSDIGIHGGECTLLSPRELEPVLELVYEMSNLVRDEHRQGRTGITTNGFNITDGYIHLFKKWNTHVGLSLDGPETLNVLRGPNPDDKIVTSRYNRRMRKIIRKLRRADVGVSIMCILHTENAGDRDKLDELKEWLLWLADLGIRGGRVNPLYSVPWNEEYELANDQLLQAWKEVFRLNIDYGLRWNPLREVQDNLLGFSLSPCTLAKCNFFQTSTVAILPDGTITNCDRTFCDELHVRADPDEFRYGSGRYSALPQSECRDCKFWSLCHGGCPATGLGGDWRSKTRFCEAWYGLYEYVAEQMRGMFPNVKLILDSDEREPFKLMSYRYSYKPSCYGGAPLREAQPPVAPVGLPGDRPHGDKPHGDHYDEARVR